MATSKRLKGVEVIRIYVTPDPRGEDGAMWQIKAPFSVKSRFEGKYPVGCFAPNRKDLMEVIAEITQWKLNPRRKRIASLAS